MTLINLEDFSELVKIEDFHFGNVTILKSNKDKELTVLWKREDKLTAERLALYTSQLSQRRQISNDNLLSLMDFKVDSISSTIDVFFEYSPYKSSIIRLGSIDVAFKWLIDVLTALSYLNSLGFVHGDMRPEFVVYFPTQRKFKIVDKFANFTHPSAALKNYIKTGKDIYASPRFFNEICNKKMKDAKFNFYKNESFSVGLVLLKILYGPAVNLKQIYNQKFKIFNTFDFLELIKKLQLNASCPKEKGLLEFLKTKLLCFNESDRLSPVRALEEAHDLIRILYGADGLEDEGANRVFLAKEHRNMLIYFSRLRLAEESIQVESKKEETDGENAEVSEVLEHSYSHSSQGKKSQTYKKSNIKIDLDELDQETLVKNRTPASQNPIFKVDLQSNNSQKKHSTNGNGSSGNHSSGHQKSKESNKEQVKHHSHVIADLEYLAANKLLKKKVLTPDIPVKRDGVQIQVETRQYPLTASNSKYFDEVQNELLLNVPFEKRTLLVKQDEWKPIVEEKARASIGMNTIKPVLPTTSTAEQIKMENTAFSFATPGTQTFDSQATNQHHAQSLGKDYELFINFTVIVPEEKILVSKKVVPSLSIDTMDSFALSIKSNQLRVKFLENDAEKETFFSLDEISKKGLSLHLTNKNSEVKLKHNYIGHTKNISSIDNIESKEPEIISSNPKVIRRYVRSNQTFSSLNTDQYKILKAQEYQLPRNESLKPNISSSDHINSGVQVIKGAYISQAYPIQPQAQQQLHQQSIFSSRSIYPSSEAIHETYTLHPHAERITTYPNSRFVNVINTTTRPINFSRTLDHESHPQLHESTKYLIANDSQRTNIMFKQSTQNVMERYGGSIDLKPSQSSVFSNRVL